MPEESDQGSSKPTDRIAPEGDAAPIAHASEALPFARTLAETATVTPRVDTHGPTLPSPDPMNHPARRVSFEAARGGASAPRRVESPAPKPVVPARAAHPVVLTGLIVLVFALAGALGFFALRAWSARHPAPSESHGAR